MKSLLFSLAFIGLISCSSWVLVLDEEFNGSALDTTKWTYDIGTDEWGWGNNELQFYTDRVDNVKVTGGNLILTAK